MKLKRLAALLFISSITTSTLSPQILALAKPETPTTPIRGSKLPKIRPKLTLVVYDFAHIDRSLLLNARDIAREIFRKSGVEVAWLECPSPQQCHWRIESTQFRIMIHPEVRSVVTDKLQAKQMIGNRTLGFAVPCSTTDSTCLFYIFYQPITTLAAQRGAGIGRILGQVMAHEIGHALLGPNAHALTGIMQDSLQLAATDPLLYFTTEQSRLLRTELLVRNGTAAK
jgi:hypothetical protein